MWRFEHVAVVSASKQVVWQWWSDVEKWPQWDTDLIESALLGEFAVGTQGRMKVADDALVSFTISEVIPEERFVMQVALFGATLSYTYAIALEEDGSLKITHGAELSGLFSFVWRLLLKSKIQKTLTLALEEFARQVTTETARVAALAPQTPSPVAEVPAEGSDVAADGQEAVPAAELKAETSAAEPAPAKAAEEAGLSAAATVDVSANASNGVAKAGDPVENELRAKDIHTQIEVAAQAPISATMAENLEKPVPVAEEPAVMEGEHTAVIPVSPVVTKKETKRPKKDS
ncbi:MAG: hypothetical protein QG632_502 [Candidatus Dependentiae bacterium]|nr:hypothetical protein [Candidatus Dependentiae bacterium]